MSQLRRKWYGSALCAPALDDARASTDTRAPDHERAQGTSPTKSGSDYQPLRVAISVLPAAVFTGPENSIATTLKAGSVFLLCCSSIHHYWWKKPGIQRLVYSI